MRDYDITLEIFEGKGGSGATGQDRPDFVKEGICAWMYRGGYEVGQTFRYPDDLGKLCPWLLDSLGGFIRALDTGAELPWMYKDTPYEKTVDSEGVTTEFVRCPDPTSCGIVMKITRTAVAG